MRCQFGLDPLWPKTATAKEMGAPQRPLDTSAHKRHSKNMRIVCVPTFGYRYAINNDMQENAGICGWMWLCLNVCVWVQVCVSNTLWHCKLRLLAAGNAMGAGEFTKHAHNLHAKLGRRHGKHSETSSKCVHETRIIISKCIWLWSRCNSLLELRPDALYVCIQSDSLHIVEIVWAIVFLVFVYT